MGKRSKALQDFQDKKASMEFDLERKAQDIADQISESFNYKRKQRKWDMSSIDIKIKDNDAVEYIIKKIMKRPTNIYYKLIEMIDVFNTI